MAKEHLIADWIPHDRLDTHASGLRTNVGIRIPLVVRDTSCRRKLEEQRPDPALPAPSNHIDASRIEEQMPACVFLVSVTAYHGLVDSCAGQCHADSAQESSWNHHSLAHHIDGSLENT